MFMDKKKRFPSLFHDHKGRLSVLPVLRTFSLKLVEQQGTCNLLSAAGREGRRGNGERRKGKRWGGREVG